MHSPRELAGGRWAHEYSLPALTVIPVLQRGQISGFIDRVAEKSMGRLDLQTRVDELQAQVGHSRAIFMQTEQDNFLPGMPLSTAPHAPCRCGKAHMGSTP